MLYTPKYFRDNMPAWKRKKDPIISRILYRPLSFVTASICANLKISANAVSYFSILIAIAGCVLFFFDNFVCNLVGAILINVWLWSDCTDGNLARSVKKQAFGEFADSISSYILVGLLGISLGVCVYLRGGVIVAPNTLWVLILGVFASEGDTLMRLIYQKYKSVERELVDKGVLQAENDVRTNKENVGSLRVRIEAELGIGGILPMLILFGAIFGFLDLVVIYCAVYYCGSCIAMTMLYIFKAIKKAKEVSMSEEAERQLTESE